MELLLPWAAGPTVTEAWPVGMFRLFDHSDYGKEMVCIPEPVRVTSASVFLLRFSCKKMKLGAFGDYQEERMSANKTSVFS